jgi:hypothetical protein
MTDATDRRVAARDLREEQGSLHRAVAARRAIAGGARLRSVRLTRPGADVAAPVVLLTEEEDAELCEHLAEILARRTAV